MKNNSFNQTASFRLVGRGKGGAGGGRGKKSAASVTQKEGESLRDLTAQCLHCSIVDTSGKLARILPKEIEGLWAGLDLVLL